MQRIALGIEYNGANYNGWQRQCSTISIQEKLEQALSQVANSDIKVFCAGRTDSMVHATGQVVHFDYNGLSERRLDAWLLGGNTLLPHDISINWAKEVSTNFHARFSAQYRRYQYYFYISPVKRAVFANKALCVRKKLNTAAMNEACKYLLGEQDFSSLRSSQCESPTPFRNVMAADIKIINNFIVLDIKANAFLHHMVRNIVGCLLEIGTDQKPASWLKQVLELKDRRQAAKTAPADGLYLIEVGYPKDFALPSEVYLPYSA